MKLDEHLLCLAPAAPFTAPLHGRLLVPGLSAQQLARVLGGNGSSSSSAPLASPSASAPAAAAEAVKPLYREIMPGEQLARRKVGTPACAAWQLV